MYEYKKGGLIQLIKLFDFLKYMNMKRDKIVRGLIFIMIGYYITTIVNKNVLYYGNNFL